MIGGALMQAGKFFNIAVGAVDRLESGALGSDDFRVVIGGVTG